MPLTQVLRAACTLCVAETGVLCNEKLTHTMSSYQALQPSIAPSVCLTHNYIVH